MKKFLSVILALSMVISLFAILPITASAETSDAVTVIDFNYEATDGYTYCKVEDDQTQYPAFPKIDGNSVYALYLTRPAGEAPHRAYLLRDSQSESNEPLALTYGTDYKISLSYKNVTSSGNYNIAVYWFESPSDAADGVPAFANKTELTDFIVTVTGSTTESNWNNVSWILTPPSETAVYPAIIAYADALHNKTEKIYFDNITVSEYEFKTYNSIDFEYEAAGNYSSGYYFNESNPNACGKTFTDLEDGTHDAVYGIYVMRNGSSPHRAYALRDTDTNRPLALKYGTDYTISLSYKNVKSTADYKIAIYWMRDASSVSSGLTPSSAYIEDLATVSASGSEGAWTTVTGTVSPAKKGYLYPVLLVYTVAQTTATNECIYFDDITVKKFEYKLSNSIDFDYEAAGNYSSSYYYNETHGEARNTTFADLNDGVHEGVYGIYVMRNGSYNHRAYALRDTDTNAPLALEYGTQYRMSVSYKNVYTTANYKIAIFWMNDVSNISGGIASDTAGYIQDLTTVSANSSECDWAKATGLITPQAEGYIYPVFMVYTVDNLTRTGQCVYFDDIIIQASKCANGTENMPASISFEDSQADFYNSYKSAINYSGELANLGDGHGNVMKFTRIVSSVTEGFASESGRSIGLSNSAGTAYAGYKKGSKLYVSLDINVAKYAEDLNGEFNIGIVFDNPTHSSHVGSTSGSSGGLYAASNAGELLQVAKVDASISGWQTVSGVITVPEHSESDVPWLVVYSDKYIQSAYSAANEVYFDNITVGNADINLDGEINIIDLIRLKKNVAAESAYNYKCDMNADGAVNASDLVNCKKMLLFNV